MQERASILNDDDREAPQPPSDGRPRPRMPMKFAYNSGATPLDGYTIKRGIGVGGFGDVYYALSDAGKEVALKRIQRNLDVELRGVRQCLNLKHPHLLTLYDIRYDDEGQAWVVMEYMAGESLQQVIERNPHGLPLDQVDRWLQGILAGVSYLHDHGIVHRDLKPGNIFCDQDLVKIGDYGLSKFISCSRRSGQTESVGTFHYMAPEIGRGCYGKEIDIYALGILLYEMLTGRVPFDGESSQEIIIKHLTAEPDLKQVPERYRAVIARALRKDPDHRYRSASEMLADLNRAGTGPDRARVHAQAAEPRRPRVHSLMPVGNAGTIPEEPVARAVRHGIQSLRDSWRRAPLGPVLRAVVTVLLLMGLAINFVWLAELAVIAAMVYAVYYAIWYVIQSNQPPQAAQGRAVMAEVIQPGPGSPSPDRPRPEVLPRTAQVRRPSRRTTRRLTRQQTQEVLRQWLGTKSGLERLTELTGSMLMAALVAAVMAIIMVAFSLPTEGIAWGPFYAWLTITSIAVSWCVLGFSKLWETSSGDQALRRFCMLAAGMILGGFAGQLNDFLYLESTYLIRDISVLGERLAIFYTPYGLPRMVAYMAYFGGLFLVLRWWLHADPLRTHRLRLFATLLTVGWAVGLHFLMPIPRGFMVAAVAAIAIQLSAPWLNEQKRKEVTAQLQDSSSPLT